MLFALPAQAAGKRLALVVGNARYEAVYSLRNPVNDSHAVADTLERLGFEVVSLDNAGREEFETAIEDFSRMAEGAEAAVFYFSGHGFQLKGANYLVPTDARLTSAAAIDKEALRLDTIISELQSRDRQTLIFLDACRNDPLPENMRGKDGESGLAEIETGSGTFVAFATAPGQITRDGIGRNSPFTTALVEHMQTPGISISDMMIRVRNEVEEATAHEQTPWDQSSLRSQFYFSPEGEGEDALTEEDRELLLSLDPALRKKFEARFGLKIETVEEGDDGGPEEMIATIVPAVTISAGGDDESDSEAAGEPEQVEIIPNLMISAADDEEPQRGTPETVRIPEPRPAQPNEPEVDVALLAPDEAPRPLEEPDAQAAPEPEAEAAAAEPAAEQAEPVEVMEAPEPAEPVAEAVEPAAPVAESEAPEEKQPDALAEAPAVTPAAPAAEAEPPALPEPQPEAVAEAPAIEPAAPAAEAEAPALPEPQPEAVAEASAIEPAAPAAEAEAPALPEPQPEAVAEAPAIEPAAPAAEAEAPAVPEPQPEAVAEASAIEPAAPAAEVEAPALPERMAEAVAEAPVIEPAAALAVEAPVAAESEVEAVAEVKGGRPTLPGGGTPPLQEHESEEPAASIAEAETPQARPEVVAMLEPPAPEVEGSRAVPPVSGESAAALPRLLPSGGSAEQAERPAAPTLVPAPEAAPGEPEKQLAALDPSEMKPDLVVPVPEKEPEAAAETPADMPRAIQVELARLGCYRSSIDGDWGPKSAKALLRYYATKKEAPDELDPNATLLAKLSNEETVVCTRTESDRTVTKKGSKEKAVGKSNKPAPSAKKPAPKVVAPAAPRKPKPGPSIATTEKKKKLSLGTGAFR